MVISVAKHEILKPPPMSSKKNTGQEYSKKNYIYTEDKKDGYSQGKSKKFIAPPCLSQK